MHSLDMAGLSIMNRIVLRLSAGLLLAGGVLLASDWLTTPSSHAASSALPMAWQSMHQAQLRVNTLGGKKPQWLTVRVADQADERAQGMQHLPASVIREQPIWFVFDEPRRTGWHMNNVALPLDIVYVDDNGVVIDIERMQPQGNGYGIRAPIAAALELAAGEAKRRGITPGTTLKLMPPVTDGAQSNGG